MLYATLPIERRWFYHMEDFSNKLRKIRTEKGFTQKKLGEMVNVSEVMIGQYERGVRFPKIEMKKKIANALGVSLSEFLSAAEYADEELGEEGLKDLSFKVELIRRFCKTFNVEITDFTPRQQEQLDKEIRDFIRFKIDQLKK